MKTVLLTTASLLIATTAAMPAYAGDNVSVSTSIDYVSEYVFRGNSFARQAIQPGVEVAIGDFTVGAWASSAYGRTSAAASDEIDLYASYSFAATETVGVDVGITYYHYPQGGGLFTTKDGNSGSYEVFASAGFDTALAPSVSAYYDFTLEAFTIEGSIGHSVPVAEKTSFDLGATAGAVQADGGGDYEYASASASLGYSFTDDVSTYIGANYALSSEDTLSFEVDGDGNAFTDSDNLLWFGVGVAAGF